MGRVKRYKKIKACDPFYRGPKKTDVDKRQNQPPKGENQRPSRSFKYFLERKNYKNEAKDKLGPNVEKKQVEKKKKDKKRKRNAKSDEESDLASQPFKRRKGESARAYLQRIDIESNNQLLASHKKILKKSEKQKQYSKIRKMKLKLKQQGVTAEDMEGMTFEDLKDQVKFGEVAMAPPSLSSKPRGTVHKAREAKKELSTTIKERNELERKRVIEMYRHLKKRTFNKDHK